MFKLPKLFTKQMGVMCITVTNVPDTISEEVMKSCLTYIKKYFPTAYLDDTPPSTNEEDDSHPKPNNTIIVTVKSEPTDKKEAMLKNIASIKSEECPIIPRLTFSFSGLSEKPKEELLAIAKSKIKTKPPQLPIEEVEEINESYSEYKETLHNDEDDDEYDSLLTEEQQKIKLRVQETHHCPSSDEIKTALDRLHHEQDRVQTVITTDRNFNSLFIFTDFDVFYDLVANQMEGKVDFSYLYIIYDTSSAPTYFGVDEITDEINDILKNLAEAFYRRQIRRKDDLKKIKGINIFKNIYFDD